MGKDDGPAGGGASSEGRLSALRRAGRASMSRRATEVSGAVKKFDAKSAVDAMLEAPSSLRREWQRTGAIGAITRFPLLTVLAFLGMTLFFVSHSGFLDNTGLDRDPDNPALNVNGDMEVYLPDGSEVSALIAKVEEDWTTDVMVIYIESNKNNITDQRILQEISYVEEMLNPYISDAELDDVIYILSLSTVIKEVNSSAPRVRTALIEELGESACPPDTEDCASRTAAQALNEILATTDVGARAIPTQGTIDLIVREMYEDDGSPTPGLDKLARNTNPCTLNGGLCDSDEDFLLDRAVMAIAVTENKPAKQIIEETQGQLDEISTKNRPCLYDENGDPNAEAGLCTWDDLGLNMTLTGPVPITNAVTEFSFQLFWDIFPMAVVFVAVGLFVFHCDLLQTGLTGIRPLQGIKVVSIAGLPTLCAVFWTMGILGWTNFEVTMTVIIVGPILLALGVSYGLHITNRYAEETGTKEEKIRAAMSSTGRAVFLSAVTTVIGFISLVFTPMAPIQTVGIALSGGIVVVYFLTMFMVPNLTLLLDLEKPKHPPLAAFNVMVEVPVRRSRWVLGVFFVLILISATVGQANVEENIDLLGMAPEDEQSVIKMKQYSDEFNAGQVGMVLVHANVTGNINDDDTSNDDPASILEQIEVLEAKINEVDNASAVSIVFLMKATGVAVSITGAPIAEFIDETPGIPDEIKDTATSLLNQEIIADASFWDVLTNPSQYNMPGDRQSQIFLLNVFYASITEETLQVFINENYDRTLILVDMPFIPVADTAVSVDEINIQAAAFAGPKGEYAEDITGVAATAIEVNQLIVDSQWRSLAFAVVLTIITLAIVFRDLKYSLLTTSPVIATVALQWLVMWQLDVPLSLVTVMIGSILVGVGVDFSIHIANRIRELGGGIDAIRTAAVGTGMSLAEAATVTSLGMMTAYQIPIPEIKPFLTVILILLWVAAAGALVLLPAIFVALEKVGVTTVGGHSGLANKLGLGRKHVQAEDIVYDAVVVERSGDAW